MTGMSRTYAGDTPLRPMPIVPAIIGATIAIIVGLLLAGSGLPLVFMIVGGAIIAGLALRAPFWAIVVTLVQFVFIPSEGTLFGYFVPNSLQWLAPMCLLGALLRALATTDHERLAFRLSDVLVFGLILWGYMGLFHSPDAQLFKWYSNRMALPALLYLATRLTRIDNRDMRTLIKVMLVAVALQSLLMIRESAAGSSPFYEVQRGLLEGVKPAKGPFPFMWNASVFLAIWPPLFVYAIARAQNLRAQVAWFLGLVLVLVANTHTMERSGVAASLLGITACLISSRLRKPVLIILGLFALGYIPWSATRAGGSLIARFQQTDESRYAYRTAAINLLKSPDWNPVFGIGWARFARLGGRHGTDEEILAWGSRRATIAQVATGARLHNVWLAMLVELGVVGALMTVGLALMLLRSALILRARKRRGESIDGALFVSMTAALLSVAAIGYYQNVYMMAETLSVAWVFYAILVTQPRVFALEQSQQPIGA